MWILGMDAPGQTDVFAGAVPQMLTGAGVLAVLIWFLQRFVGSTLDQQKAQTDAMQKMAGAFVDLDRRLEAHAAANREAATKIAESLRAIRCQGKS